MLPIKVNVVEVGPRDGLQNEKQILDIETKIELINKLSETGLKNIEVGSFVSPKAIPQMHDTDAVLQRIQRYDDVNYSVLIPNKQGMEQALYSSPSSIALFTAVSEKFCQKNINCSIEESFTRAEEVVALANSRDIPIRGYLSCVLGCPYEGEVDVHKVADLAVRLIDMGCYEISLGDTIGVGTISKVQELISIVSNKIDINKLAVHFHNTYGQALVNVYTALQMGIKTVDSSVAGLGGCPYAKGASGNLATEELVYMLNGLGIESNVNLNMLYEVVDYVNQNCRK